MMDQLGGDEEEFQFFDAPEEIVPEFDQGCRFCSNKDWEYDVWLRTPDSVGERRRNFIGLMGLSAPESGEESAPESGEETLGERDDCDGCVSVGDVDRIVENNGAVLRGSCIGNEFSSSRSSEPSWDTDGQVLSRGVSSCEYECGMVESQKLGKIRATRLGHLLSFGKFENVPQVRSSVRKIDQGAVEANCCNTPRKMDKLKVRWLRRWRSMGCVSGNVTADTTVLDGFSQAQRTRICRVKVRHCQRKLKELSALFAGQDIQAHKGSILTMKFSPDGQYLASAGEDKVVRLWQVVEDERADTIDIPDADPSCVYFSVNHLSELGPLVVEKDDVNKPKSLRKSPDSACIVFPQKVFRILEKPLHVFQGHSAEILDLSWSKNNCLLSSSIDKTVRLWRIGDEQCLKVFYHTNYVTCIQFNPHNDDCFISGSLDGKVRIWRISSCQVVQWAEMKDIITAVSYRPNGQGGIIGSITGTCRFFNISDDNFQLDAEILLTNKKSTCKRITGFQFFPQDLSKVLVTSADSHVRIIDGSNVIGKFKGLRKAGNYMSATFTSDGKHIVSASDDSNVYIWNYISEGEASFQQTKVVKSFERFPSDSSVAVPWPGLKPGTLGEHHIHSLPFSSPASFSSSHENLLVSTLKGSATWPEEKLSELSPWPVTPQLSKSQYRLFMTSCQSSSNTHAWGLVIVTAGWDGRIRSFHNYGLPVPLKSR